MIHEAKIEIAVVAAHATGEKFCMAKFMYEEEARAWMESQEPVEWREWLLYERRVRRGVVEWTELS